ncbi:uncharacterized protein LOC144886431 [Branchiostoma floridae x Branchiostoma japonicum]
MMLLLVILCFGVLQTSGAVTPPTVNTSTAQRNTELPVTVDSTTKGLSLVVHTDRELEVFRTKSIDLRCSFDNITSNVLYQVSWYKLNDDNSPGSAFITSLHGQEVHVEERQEELGLEGRVSIQLDGLSLNITDVAVHDEGIYRCEVTVLQPLLAKASSDVNLTVVDYQIRGYTENMVVGKGTPVTLTAIVSGSKLRSQNSWRLNGQEPLSDSAVEATLMDQDGRWAVISTFTFQHDVDNTVTVTFTSYIPSANTASDTVDNSTRTVEVQQVIVFRDIDVCLPRPCQNGGQCTVNGDNGYDCECEPGFTGPNCQFRPTDSCDCRVATFAATEAGCTMAATVLVLITFFAHIFGGCNNKAACGWYSIGYPLIVTLFLGVVIGIPVNFFAVQKVMMDAGSATVIVFSALTPFVLLGITLLIAL